MILIYSIFILGIISTFAGFFGLYNFPLFFLLIFPVIFTMKVFIKKIILMGSLTQIERILYYFILIIWLSHLVQVFTPEIGFDAVWYHLPIVRSFIDSGEIFYINNFYQSANPIFSDLIFLLGFSWMGEIGTKLIAYLFGVSLIVISYKLSRLFLNKVWSLVAIITISLIQTVAWQSSSFYVDIAKAMWELSALYLILKPSLNIKTSGYILSGLMFGSSLATKLFSILLLPFMIFIVLYKSQSIKKTFLFSFFSFLVVMPFYWYTFSATGHPFFSFTKHIDGLIGGNNNILLYFFTKLLLLPQSIIYLIKSRDYISPILFLTLPLSLFLLKMILKQKDLISKNIKILAIFSIVQWLIWWYVPPLSTRYALSGFIIMIIFTIKILNIFLKEYPRYKKILALYVSISLVLTFMPRLYVNYRSMNYLLGNQTKKQYIEQFYDGNIDEKLKEWHQDI